jgi:nitroreductase
MILSAEQVTKAIQNRRSIFPAQYSDEKVSDVVIEEMLENANWAPTHKLTEPWRFIVFTDAGLRKLADFQSELYRKESTSKGTFSDAKYTKLKEKPLKCSHIISIGMKRHDKKAIPVEEEIAAVSCAVQNMMLTAAAHGVGCYWGTGGITYYESAKEFFGLKEDDMFMGFLFIGKPKGDWPAGRRKSIKEKVYWVRSE